MLSMGHAPKTVVFSGFLDERIEIRSLLPQSRNRTVEKRDRKLKTPDAISLYL
jgi:hypothetical protein